jgi:hypothetical protein
MYKFLLMCLAAIPFVGYGNLVIVTDGSKELGSHDIPVVEITPFPEWGGLKEFADSTGIRPGQFPVLVNTDKKIYAFITQTVGDALVEISNTLAIVERSKQETKPLEQRQYEKTFFELTEQLLTALDDPRAGQEPPVKLSFPEIDAILEQLFEADLATATRASIKLLGIDAALKRYNTLWWDDAIQHELPEE